MFPLMVLKENLNYKTIKSSIDVTTKVPDRIVVVFGDTDNPDVFLEEPGSSLDEGVINPNIWVKDFAPVGLPGHTDTNSPTLIFSFQSL